MTKFDLHLHTNNSDGSDTTEQLIDKVMQKGINIFAITDHDTVQGIIETENKIPENIKFIKGVELTCKTNGIKCHILGYNINPYDAKLTELIKKGKTLRKQKLETRIKYLKEEWNINLTQEELNWLYSRKSVVKTHIANILVNRGLSDDNVSAMKKYLDGCKTGDTRFDGTEAIQVIKHAGGIPVWAHPLGGEGEKHLSEEEFLPKLKIMIEAGIQGLECYYSRYSLAEAEFLLNCAKENNLIITGGSDYHGTNKTVQLGALNTEGIYIDYSQITTLKMSHYKKM